MCESYVRMYMQEKEKKKLNNHYSFQKTQIWDEEYQIFEELFLFKSKNTKLMTPKVEANKVLCHFQ